MARYLSLDWLDDLSAVAATSAPLREAALGRHFTVNEVVTDTPEGDVAYHLDVADGSVAFGAGPADGAEVLFVQDHDTAVGIALGRVNAQEAFVSGRLKITGDMELLIASQPVFAALDAVFTEVRARTEYPE